MCEHKRERNNWDEGFREEQRTFFINKIHTSNKEGYEQDNSMWNIAFSFFDEDSINLSTNITDRILWC